MSDSHPHLTETLRVEYPLLDEHLRSILGDLSEQRVLIAMFNQWPFALASATDVAAELHSQGAQVFLALWGARTPLPDIGASTYSWVDTLLRQVSTDGRALQALKSFGLPASAFLDPPRGNQPPVERIQVPHSPTRSQVRQLTYRGSPLGRALLQVHPDRETPMAEDHVWPSRWVEQAARSYAFAYDNVRAAIEEHGITSVLVYNGRFLHDQAAWAAARDAGVQVFFHDSAATQSDYEVTWHGIHDWATLQTRMLDMYADWPEDERDALGSSWFEDRVGHRDPHNRTFVDGQVQGRTLDLPADKQVVVYFSSSADEIIELDINWDEYFGNQDEALRVLAEEVRALDAHVLVVRSHPHKRLKPTRDREEWVATVESIGPDIHLDPFSDVDSYALMREADVVVTYGSTSGVEAAYARRPVIVMGPSAYDLLGCAERVRTRDELRAALEAKKVGNWSGAVSYGLMAVRRGHLYRHVRRDADGTPTLAGVSITEPNTLARRISHAIRQRRLRRLIAR